MADTYLHPMLDSLKTVHDAVVLHGVNDGSPLQDGLAEMGFHSSFDPWDETPTKTDILYLYHPGMDLQVSFGFTHQPSIDGPMIIHEFDEDEFIARIIPVVATIILRPHNGVRFARETHRIADAAVVQSSLILCTPDSVVLEIPEMFDYKPVFGMFDGPPYRFVGDVVARNAPLDEIVSLATDIL